MWDSQSPSMGLSAVEMGADVVVGSSNKIQKYKKVMSMGWENEGHASEGVVGSKKRDFGGAK